MKRLVVYGTLRTGGHFARVMPKVGKCEVHKLKGVRVYKTPSFFPGAEITGNKDDYVVAEVWDFEGHLTNGEWDHLIMRLDAIEGVHRYNPAMGLFRCETVDTPLGEAYIYVMNDKDLVESTRKKNVIVNDWADVAEDIKLPGGQDGKVKSGKANARGKTAGES